MDESRKVMAPDTPGDHAVGSGLADQRPALTPRQAGTRLLVSTPNPPEEGLYLLETGTGAVRRLQGGRIRGLCQGPESVYFAEHDGKVFRLDPHSLVITAVLETGQRGCHDVRWIGGYFYLVASFGNRVTRYSPNWERIDEFQVIPDEGDVCHANCLVERDGELLLSVFTLTPGRRETKNTTPAWRTAGKVLRLDWEGKSYEVAFEPLSQPHSLVPDGDRILCCESHEASLVEVSLDRLSKRRLRKLHGFVRGMIHHGNSLWVGISHPKRHTQWTMLDRLLGHHRFKCGLLELDPVTYRTRARYPLPGLEVYDILALDP